MASSVRRLGGRGFHHSSGVEAQRCTLGPRHAYVGVAAHAWVYRVEMPSTARRGSALEELGRERAARDAQVLRHVGEDTGEGPDAETGVIGDGDVMFAALLRGEPEVAPVSRITAYPYRRKARASARPGRSRGAAPLGGHDFVVDQVESDHLRAIGTASRIAVCAQLVEVVRLGFARGEQARRAFIQMRPQFRHLLGHSARVGHSANLPASAELVDVIS